MGDKQDRFLEKFGGKTRNYAQKTTLNLTGDPHAAADGGLVGLIGFHAVADPANLVPGGSGAKILKALPRVGKGIKGAETFADAVAVTKQGVSLSERSAVNASKTQTAAKQGSVLAERGVVATTEKVIAKDMSPGVKPKLKRGKNGQVTGVEKTQIHHIVHQSFSNDSFLQKIGYDINQRANRIILPTVEGAPCLQQSALSIKVLI